MQSGAISSFSINRRVVYFDRVTTTTADLRSEDSTDFSLSDMTVSHAESVAAVSFNSVEARFRARALNDAVRVWRIHKFRGKLLTNATRRGREEPVEYQGAPVGRLRRYAQSRVAVSIRAER